MRKELEKQLIDEYPVLFKDTNQPDTVSCMADGCVVGDGWFGIIKEACQKASEADPEAYLLQVKEKFGGLRMYAAGNRKSQAAFDEAETKSFKTCEYCGSEDDVTSEGRWIKTVCRTCRG